MKPTLTIAIPTYNGAKTICSTIDSVLSQYNPRIEFLIINNCSIDNSEKIIEKYVSDFPFIQVVKNNKNIGSDANFLKAMRISNGKFVLLLSDDDVLVENSLVNILNFLDIHPDIGLVYLHTVVFYQKYSRADRCIRPGEEVDRNICTEDRKLFMHYAAHFWGFMSSFICATDCIRKIDNAEQFFGTYWLQSYIHILCVSDTKAKLGVIKGPCIGAGAYINLATFDTSLVDGIYYLKMLKFAVENGGFDSNQLTQIYQKRISNLGKRAVIKERAAGIKKTSIKRLVKCTYMHPKAWVTLFPFLLLPSPLCRIIMSRYRKLKHVSGEMRINRPE